MSRDTIYERYIECHWWTDIDKRQVNSWLLNFGSEKDIGKLILDNVFFYSKDQLISYTKNILNQIKGELFQKNQLQNGMSYNDDMYYFNQWENYKQCLRVIPAAKLGDVGESGYEVIRKYYRSLLGNDVISDISGIEDGIVNQVKEFIFVDDFSGSGNQMKEFLETEVSINGKTIRLCNLSREFPDITITIAVYVIHKNALTMLNENFPQIKIRYIDLIDEKFDFLNCDSIFYSKLSNEKRIYITEFIKEKREVIVKDNSKYEKMMGYQLNIPIVFYHGCPNNTLMLLYADSSNWKKIFKLGDEI